MGFIGFRVVISRVISPVTWVITTVTLLITLLITTHAPPSKAMAIGCRLSRSDNPGGTCGGAKSFPARVQFRVFRFRVWSFVFLGAQ